jgi:hypothetical protein
MKPWKMWEGYVSKARGDARKANFPVVKPQYTERDLSRDSMIILKCILDSEGVD